MRAKSVMMPWKSASCWGESERAHALGRVVRLVSVMMLAVVACRDATLPVPRTGFEILERPVGTQHDTVNTVLPGRLRAVLRDSSGAPRPDVLVRVSAELPFPNPNPFSAALQFRPADDQQAAWQANQIDVRTNAHGEIGIAVRLGILAGEWNATLVVLEVRPPAQATIGFVVEAGTEASIEILPRDSAVYVDRSYQLRTRVLDAYGNPRSDPTVARSDSDAVEISATGLVTGRRVGRALLRITSGGANDSAWVSVVPRGTITAARELFDEPGGMPLVEFGLDGSDYHVVVDRRVEQVAWAPSGDRLAYMDVAWPFNTNGRIFVRELAGPERALLAEYGDSETQRDARFSQDESWVYFAGRSDYPAIMRAHPDGSALEAIAVVPSGVAGAMTEPAPSPDGKYLAFSAFGLCGPDCPIDNGVRVVDLATRTTLASGLPGVRPMWIPGTDTLITTDGTGFTLLRPDGRVVRTIDLRRTSAASFDISPDGRWLVAPSSSARVVLVNLETGMRLPLEFLTGVLSVSWRPK